MIKKRKKHSRMRGHGSHGWGAKKKHRGSGNRGGKGMAGSGKRGDAKKPSIWKSRYFGKLGFTTSDQTKTITIRFIEENASSLAKEGILSQENGLNIVKVEDKKLLSSGKPTKKYKIFAASASAAAIEKIASAGGEVILPADQ